MIFVVDAVRAVNIPTENIQREIRKGIGIETGTGKGIGVETGTGKGIGIGIETGTATGIGTEKDVGTEIETKRGTETETEKGTEPGIERESARGIENVIMIVIVVPDIQRGITGGTVRGAVVMVVGIIIVGAGAEVEAVVEACKQILDIIQVHKEM